MDGLPRHMEVELSRLGLAPDSHYLTDIEIDDDVEPEHVWYPETTDEEPPF